MVMSNKLGKGDVLIQPDLKDDFEEDFEDELLEEQMEKQFYKQNKAKKDKGKQLVNQIGHIIGEEKITCDELRGAIVWSEIIGKPVCKTRGRRRQERK